jgi:hypothetical protein
VPLSIRVIYFAARAKSLDPGFRRDDGDEVSMRVVRLTVVLLTAGRRLDRDASHLSISVVPAKAGIQRLCSYCEMIRANV